MDIEQWHQHVLAPLLEGRSPAAEDVDALGGLALLAADADRTQDFVFESTRLPEIRGASRMLDDLNTTRLRALFRKHGLRGDFIDQEDAPGEIIYVGGGGLLALVPVTVADKLRQAMEALYPAVTGVATLTVDWRPVTPEMVLQGYPTGGFGGLVRWAGTWLRRRKEDKLPPPFYEAPSHAMRCHSCHLRPAKDDRSLPDWPLCEPCYQKRNAEGRDYWFHAFHEYVADHPDLPYYAGLTAEERRELTRWGHKDSRSLPQDLSELAQASRGKPGYVGFIHLDGDELGNAFFASSTLQAYRTFSQAIETTTRQAVFQSLAQWLRPARVSASPTRQEVEVPPAPGEPVWIHPFEILTIGGDDVWLIVPGDVAIPVATAIAQAFTEAGLQRPHDQRPCTLSGGVVIADDHNPVRVLQDIAKQLARSAKQTRHKAPADVGYIDFHIFRSADMLDRNVEQIRRLHPYADNQAKLQRFARPYPAAQLLEAWRQLETLRTQDGGFPKSQMHLLAEALLRGRQEATLFYEYQRARDADGHYERLDQALQTLAALDPNIPRPWIDAQKATNHRYTYRTALWDLAELYDFVTPAQEVSDDEA